MLRHQAPECAIAKQPDGRRRGMIYGTEHKSLLVTARPAVPDTFNRRLRQRLKDETHIPPLCQRRR
jgi:hypothetical protein